MFSFCNFFKKKQIEVLSPVDGEVINITDVDDEVFNEKMLGDGVALIPAADEFYAPFAGRITSVFPTNHAYGIQHWTKVDCLLHIGLDTVNLKGKGFEPKVKQGQKVKANELLAVVNWSKIAGEIKSNQSPLIFLPDSLKGKKITNIKLGSVKAGEIIAIIQ
ncbi:PTS glucose transporter subunit IIA [Spiroplasma endosymbiont of Asaphidion curtum]|uniref:PTS sugar transporter subunit IIA n=1 Tax=Spiroplasma endosymbiont of Asaphidion curtum TaxID=3066281 RepID=UPI00313BDC87